MPNLEIVDAASLLDISRHALKTVDERFGQGPDIAVRPDGYRSYHNGLHSRNVVQDSTALAAAHDLSPLLQLVGNAACAAHDLDQELGSGTNETASADWLREQIEARTSLGTHMATMGWLAVRGTEPIMQGFLMVDQLANQQEYQTADQELLAKLVACADLGRLYAPDGPYAAHLLAREFAGSPADDQVAYEKLLAFQRTQPAFLEAYQYPLASAANLLTRHEVAVRDYAEELVDAIALGDVSNWQDVIRRDHAFAEAHLS